MLLKQRRGIAVTFNWIFSIIVGVIILSFFIYFAVQHTDLFGKVTAKQVGWELDNVFSGFQTSLVETTLDFDKIVKLEFKCSKPVSELDQEEQEVFINGKPGTIFRDKLIFSPKEELGNNKFLLWTYEWKVPYKVSNFIFLTTPGIKYELSGPEPDIELPEFFEDLEMSGAKREIKFTEDSCNAHHGDENLKIISYEYDNINDEYYGWICTKDKKHGFYGRAMIYAAIFSDDFDCVYNIMMEKLRVVSKVYDKKASLIDPGYTDNTLLYKILEERKDIEGITNPENFKDGVNGIIEYNERRFGENEALLY